MIKEMINWAYDFKEKRFRGSFTTLCSSVFAHLIYTLIAFLLYYAVCIKGEHLADLTALISAFIVSVAGGHTYNTVSYHNNRSRANKYARGNAGATVEDEPAEPA